MEYEANLSTSSIRKFFLYFRIADAKPFMLMAVFHSSFGDATADCNPVQMERPAPAARETKDRRDKGKLLIVEFSHLGTCDGVSLLWHNGAVDGTAATASVESTMSN